jgi:hypothetical protein
MIDLDSDGIIDHQQIKTQSDYPNEQQTNNDRSPGIFLSSSSHPPRSQREMTVILVAGERFPFTPRSLLLLLLLKPALMLQ